MGEKFARSRPPPLADAQQPLHDRAPSHIRAASGAALEGQTTRPTKVATIESTKMEIDLNRRAAMIFAVVLMALQGCRSFCFGRWPESLAQWPIELDAYVTGGFLILGSWMAGQKRAAGRAILGAGWGFSCGILYRTFFEQLGDPSRHAGAQGMVLAFKGMLMMMAVAGLIGTARASVAGSLGGTDA
jgi:hypothetical protein